MYLLKCNDQEHTKLRKRIEQLEKSNASLVRVDVSQQKRIEQLESALRDRDALIDRAVEWYDRMPTRILEDLLREHYPPLRELINDMRKAREVK